MPPAQPLSDQAPSGHAAMTEMTTDTAAPAGGNKSAEAREIGASDKEKEHFAASLLEILAQPDNAINPHVRSMAMDTLQALLPEIDTPGFLHMLARRLCLMERPPASLLRTLLAGNDREIVQTLLLDARMPESLLVEIAERGDPEVLCVLARRRRLSTAVCNALLKSDDAKVMLELLRNRNAVIEEHGYWAIVRRAHDEHGLHAPLVTREDLPAAVAFDLFWDLPPMQRRFVISRFVSDSDMLERILKIVRPITAEPDDATDRAMHIETMIAMICDGDTDAAAQRLSRLAGLHADACGRIVSDASGEALTITFKALGLQRRVFTDVIGRIRNAPASPLDGRRDIEELRILFDTLSTNKSWVMLTYWDWSARALGPYSDRDAVPGEPEPVRNVGNAPDEEPSSVPDSLPLAREAPESAGIADSSQPEERMEGTEEEEPPHIGRKEPEEVAEAKGPAHIEETLRPEENRPESESVKEEAAAAIGEGKLEGVADGADDERLPDDPLARIDALLRQLQKAARGSESKKERGKVA